MIKTMKLLITGDRNGFDLNRMIEEIKLINPTEIIVGDARGVDYSTFLIVKQLNIPINPNNENKPYKANWDKYGKMAGPIRNKEMLDQKPDFVLAFHSNYKTSKGTKNCIEQAKLMNIPYKLVEK